MKELKFIGGDRPVTEKELADARSNRIRGYAQKFETLENVAGAIAETWWYGLPMSELARLPQGLAKVSLADVNASARNTRWRRSPRSSSSGTPRRSKVRRRS